MAQTDRHTDIQTAHTLRKNACYHSLKDAPTFFLKLLFIMGEKPTAETRDKALYN